MHALLILVAALIAYGSLSPVAFVGPEGSMKEVFPLFGEVELRGGAGTENPWLMLIGAARVMIVSRTPELKDPLLALVIGYVMARTSHPRRTAPSDGIPVRGSRVACVQSGISAARPSRLFSLQFAPAVISLNGLSAYHAQTRLWVTTRTKCGRWRDNGGFDA